MLPYLDIVTELYKLWFLIITNVINVLIFPRFEKRHYIK